MSQVRRLLPLGACALLVALPAGVDAAVTAGTPAVSAGTPGTILPREGAITFKVGGKVKRVALGDGFERVSSVLGPSPELMWTEGWYFPDRDATRDVKFRDGRAVYIRTVNPLDTISGSGIVGRSRSTLEPLVSTGFTCTTERARELACRKYVPLVPVGGVVAQITFVSGFVRDVSLRRFGP
jgi:hypothetical protein